MMMMNVESQGGMVSVDCVNESMDRITVLSV